MDVINLEGNGGKGEKEGTGMGGGGGGDFYSPNRMTPLLEE